MFFIGIYISQKKGIQQNALFYNIIGNYRSIASP